MTVTELVVNVAVVFGSISTAASALVATYTYVSARLQAQAEASLGLAV